MKEKIILEFDKKGRLKSACGVTTKKDLRLHFAILLGLASDESAPAYHERQQRRPRDKKEQK